MMTTIIAASRRRYRAAVLGDGAAALWSLNGNANDELGTYNGTAVGSPSYVDGAIPGNLAVTTASGKYITTPNSAGIKPAFPFSLEFWAKDPNAAAVMWSTDNHITTGNYYGSIIQMDPTYVYVSFGNGGAAGPTSRRSWYALYSFSPATWYHVTIVCTSITDVKFYVNGFQCATVSDGGTAATLAYSGSVGRIGGRLDGTNVYAGSIDEVAIYPTALSAARAIAHYQAARPPA